MSAQMKLDHYVARTYLKHFGDPSIHGRLNAYRKSGGRPFQPWPADVCRDWGDDLNVSFLPHRPELLGDYRHIRASLEPGYRDPVGGGSDARGEVRDRGLPR